MITPKLLNNANTKYYLLGVYANGMCSRRLAHAKSVHNRYIQGQEEFLDIGRERSRGSYERVTLVKAKTVVDFVKNERFRHLVSTSHTIIPEIIELVFKNRYV